MRAYFKKRGEHQLLGVVHVDVVACIFYQMDARVELVLVPSDLSSKSALHVQPHPVFVPVQYQHRARQRRQQVRAL